MGSLYVVSDVHGYRDDLLHVLVEAGLLDADGDWRGHEDGTRRRSPPSTWSGWRACR